MGKWLIGALLATVSAVAGGAPAQAQAPEGREGWRERHGGEQQQAQGQPRAEGQRGGWRNQASQGQPPAQVDVQAQPQAEAQTGGRRGGWNGEARAQAPVQGENTYQRRDWQRQQQATPAQVVPQQNWSNGDGRHGWSNRDGDGRRDWSSHDRDGDGRADRWNGRDGRPQVDGQSWRNNGRYDNGRNDNRGYDNRGWNDGQRYDHRGNWNRTWRQDNRYDWNRYRSGNRNAFRLPRYYAPYGSSYGYRRFSIGVALSSVFWGQNYWIADPWSYRLPEAYGPYRWVRYYNDALLVDVRTGTVVDTVYDIFYY